MNTTAILKRAVEVFSFACCLVAPISAPASCPGASLDTPETMTKSMRVCLTLYGTILKGYRDIGTPLHRAAESSNDPAIVAAMVDAGADPNARNEVGFTPYAWLPDYVEKPAVKEALLEAGADPTAEDDLLDEKPWRPVALYDENPGKFEAWLVAGADSNERDRYGRTPLHVVAQSNENPAVIEVLLAAGADLL